MAHTFDTKTRSVSAITNPRIINHTCVGNATVLVLSITTTGAPAVARTGGAPTCNTATFIQAGTTQIAAVSPEETKELWYCLVPPTGVPLTISVPNTGATAVILETYSFIASAGNVSVFDAAHGGNNTTTNPSDSITTVAANALVISTVGSGATTWAPTARTIGGSAGTLLFDVDDGAFGNGSQYLLNAGVAGVKACAWTFGTSEDWAICSVSFTETAGPATYVKPTLVSYGASSYSVTTTPKTVSVTYLTGDIIIVAALAADSGAWTAPTLTGVVFGLVKSNVAASSCASAVYAGIATSGGTANVSMGFATNIWGYSVRVYRSCGGLGFNSEQHTATRTVALTPVHVESAINWIVGDFAALAVVAITPTPTNTRQNTQIVGVYTFYDAELDDQTSSGSVSYGIAAGGASTFSIIVVEVRGLASAGTVFPQSVGGTLTPAGVLVKQINKIVVGVLTPSANVFKFTTKTMVGAITPAGAISKLTTKTMGGTIAPTGSLLEQIVFTKGLTGALSFSGQLVKTTLKSLVGILTPHGVVTKQTAKSMSGTLTPTGVLLHNAIFVRALTGTLNAIADLIELFIPGTPPATSDVNWVSTWIKSVWKRGGK